MKKSSIGPPASGAMVILSKQGADPGFHEKMRCSSDGSLETCYTLLYFDTTYTDQYGTFRFDSLKEGSYVIVAAQDGLLALI